MKRNVGSIIFMAGLAVLSIGVTIAFVNKDNSNIPATNSHIEESIAESSSQTSTELTSTEDSSIEASSEAASSKETSSKTTSSKETSSKATSSKETSSKETSSKDTSSKSPSIEPTYDGTISIAKVDTSKMQALYNRNKDTVGWIKIPNTNIDYGVVEENYYGEYMNLDYNKNYYNGGNVIWTDADANFGTRDQLVKNTVIYGHNWTNYKRPLQIGRASDKHFSQLPAYDYINFARSNPYISFSTLEEEMYWQIFAVFYVEAPATGYGPGTKDFFYIEANPASLTALANEAMERSIHDFGVTVSENDKIITLSTCTRVYNKEALAAGRTKEEQRFVVMAKLMPRGAELNPMNITENKDFKKPQF